MLSLGGLDICFGRCVGRREWERELVLDGVWVWNLGGRGKGRAGEGIGFRV